MKKIFLMMIINCVFFLSGCTMSAEEVCQKYIEKHPISLEYELPTKRMSTKTETYGALLDAARWYNMIDEQQSEYYVYRTDKDNELKRFFDYGNLIYDEHADFFLEVNMSFDEAQDQVLKEYLIKILELSDAELPWGETYIIDELMPGVFFDLPHILEDCENGAYVDLGRGLILYELVAEDNVKFDIFYTLYPYETQQACILFFNTVKNRSELTYAQIYLDYVGKLDSYKEKINAISNDLLCDYEGCELDGCYKVDGETGSYCYKHKSSLEWKHKKADREYKNTGQGSGSSSKDMYDVYEYNDPDDFYDDHYDEFDSFEDAEDYYYEAWE